jgi:hypothetical protein
MAISESDSKKMRRLAEEGKRIAQIVREDFPTHEYSEVYLEVYGNGQRSAQGVKRMITNRLKEMAANPSKAERDLIANELHKLVWGLYNNHKTNQEKLNKIRRVLGM